jgi:outer membrane protein TolC
MKKKITALVCLLSGLIPAGSAGVIFAAETHTITWAECVSNAEINNPDIVSARESIMQKEADWGIARAPMLPQISASAGADKAYTVTEGASRNGKNYTYGISAKQLIFDGFKTWYDLKSADVKTETQRYAYIAASATVRLNLRTAFVDLIKAQEMMTLAKDIESRRKHIMDLVKIRYDSGSENRGSYYAAKADYAQAQADTTAATRDLAAARRKLLTLMGNDADDEIVVTEKLELTERYTDQPDLYALADKNPLVKKAVSTKDAAAYDAKSSLLAYSPKLYGTASAERSGSSIPLSQTNYIIGLQMTAPLFTGGDTWYANKKAESVLRQSESDIKSARETAIRTLTTSWNSLKSGIENVDVQNQYLGAAKERSTIGEAKYSIGLLTFDNWTIIEDGLVSARKSYLEACAAALRAEATWIQSIGGSLENETKN